ncbi:hypothetical protein [Methylobacterium soli]|uniref:Uncharacterized protein n=1 Tax=Methylobacterium soli TaxID=553447 RepID=A0A6L3SUG0_9HYPH|nr:hypothetical protein [Methylobacterium soli]KAB1073543.1 hypothetical protein F6X53_26945 [Methylobacterium soli]GJE44084.1 hypothetical protein AEGHOMDF_3270 [Methylobacterium soli]
MNETPITHAEALEMAQTKAVDSNLARRYVELHAEYAQLREAAEGALRQMGRAAAPDDAYTRAANSLDEVLRSSTRIPS